MLFNERINHMEKPNMGDKYAREEQLGTSEAVLHDARNSIISYD